MAALTNWLLSNANALSGYVVLLIGVVAFVWALGTGKLYLGRNIERILTERDARIATCEAALLQCQHPPLEVA